jgi:hypothetical protein
MNLYQKRFLCINYALGEEAAEEKLAQKEAEEGNHNGDEVSTCGDCTAFRDWNVSTEKQEQSEQDSRRL